VNTILVIDDEPGIRFSIGQVLTASDVELLQADCAADGVRIAAEERPDVILLDLRFGPSNELDTFVELKRVHPTGRIVVVTGHTSGVTSEQASRLGAFACLVKPLDANLLRRTVAEAIAAGADYCDSLETRR